MSFYSKYLKYKNKYLELKRLIGGLNEDMTIQYFPTNTLFYHGSYNKINGKLFTPSYYSIDPLQSLGHLLSTSTKLIYSKEPSRNDLDKISTCYPIIYTFTNKENLCLLHLLNVHKYDNTFGKILNKDIYKEYLNKNPDKILILQNFTDKLLSLKIIKEKPIINEINFDELYDKFFYKYLQDCEVKCFTGWSNTPGYYLLSNIDYNKYLREIIPNIMKDIEIDGIYVERDQDEIILFNNSKINDEVGINYILPYYFYENKDIEKAKQYILDYDKKSKRYLDNKDDKQTQQELINKYKQFSYINESGISIWNFDWFFTFCEKFNPVNFVPNVENCPTLSAKNLLDDENCVKRYQMNPLNTGIEEENIDYGFLSCDSPKFTNKISISDVSQSKSLELWLKNITFFNDKILNINDYICNNRIAMLNRVL
jgi:hypothetical protein